GAKSIVEFSAAILNRWGQVVFRFKDINDEWDGTYKGKPVKDGVYFLDVNAKGADGRVFRIRKDVNILRGYIESEINS
ncbi:MAG: gliding motility-associated C-terminal domain-containing protein, partial [Bacteroidaceae bacterium]|nr:gliding motility-associated C-terminal domain-containing protein [Bacteroidaceae bacterium]